MGRKRRISERGGEKKKRQEKRREVFMYYIHYTSIFMQEQSKKSADLCLCLAACTQYQTGLHMRHLSAATVTSKRSGTCLKNIKGRNNQKLISHLPKKRTSHQASVLSQIMTLPLFSHHSLLLLPPFLPCLFHCSPRWCTPLRPGLRRQSRGC